jgi:predicted Zn-dependent protease
MESGSAPDRGGLAALASRLVASVRSSLGVDAVAASGGSPPASPGAERVAARRRAEEILASDEDPAEAVALLAPLVERHPADAAALELLGRARVAQRDLTGAADATRRALALEPASATLHAQAGRIALVTGDLEGASRECRRAVDLDGDLSGAHAGLALAQLLGGQRDAAIATWEGLARRGPEAASVAAEGLADLASFEGRLGDARALLEEGIAADQARGDAERNGYKLAMLGEVLLAEGQPGRAALAAERARRTSGSVHLQCMAGRVLADAGDLRGPEAVVYDLAARSSPAAIACAELVLAMQQLHRHAYADAVDLASAARRRVDAWGTRAVLGRAYQEAGAMAQAHDELESCMTRRGEGAMAFLDGHPTARLIPPVMFRLGTVRESLGDADSADILREFVRIRKAKGDPLSAEAQRRISRSPAARN